jgi:hypothetical protein
VVLAAVAFVALTPAARAAGPLWWVTGLLLVVVCANAVNIIDGQDGLAGGLAVVAALAVSVLVSAAGLSTVALTALAVAGALVGFLVWNRPPARIFLGNGGAYGVGALLGILAWFLTGEGSWRPGPAWRRSPSRWSSPWPAGSGVGPAWPGATGCTRTTSSLGRRAEPPRRSSS